MTPERIRVPAVAAITGLSVRTVQHMAARDKIPGAARLGGVWTFDEARLRAWIREREVACQGTSIGAAKHGGAEFSLPAATIDEAYARLIGRKRAAGLRNGARR